jgi:hypothetical protein
MYDKRLRHEGHTRRFAIEESAGAWEVRTEEDSQLVRQVRYDDWHRVERALLTMRLQVSELEEDGWVPV